ncbi:uncharacterized protein BJ171DRAFT_168768 [Polychytrium aggregatum]|uniref:uncharacterized protein n=1 Tax=Polychytrium aggregatum TaxID=110093 RepID=UPI0022FDB448|nr:uncharacterized protein BJ171DRAFT_168768 [Polychytrium aggregatum]KAI9208812.1 hypothetical protein BJ171DRAFT_168768 [Polychytrium aggregatum]
MSQERKDKWRTAQSDQGQQWTGRTASGGSFAGQGCILQARATRRISSPVDQARVSRLGMSEHMMLLARHMREPAEPGWLEPDEAVGSDTAAAVFDISEASAAWTLAVAGCRWLSLVVAAGGDDWRSGRAWIAAARAEDDDRSPGFRVVGRASRSAAPKERIGEGWDSGPAWWATITGRDRNRHGWTWAGGEGEATEHDADGCGAGKRLHGNVMRQKQGLSGQSGAVAWVGVSSEGQRNCIRGERGWTEQDGQRTAVVCRLFAGCLQVVCRLLFPDCA